MQESTETLEQCGRTKGAGVVCVSRQPIYSRTIDLFAYELLYQNDAIETALSVNGGNATAEILLNTCFDVGLEPLVGDRLAFINVPRMFVLQDYCRALPKERIVLGIPNDIEPEETVVRSLKSLSETGYSVALDNFQYSDKKCPLLELASYVSVDFDSAPLSEIATHMPLLREFKARLVAKGLDTFEEFEHAKDLGFHYFRGSCFNKPKAVKATRIPINRLTTLQLVVKLQEPELSIAELEKIVGHDVAISFQLLRYINSASLTLSRKISSIKHAIQMVGTQRIRCWGSLLLLTKLDDAPPELMVTSLVRATMAERLATAMGAGKPDSYFMVGLFSVLDALLNLPMHEAIELLPLSTEVREALVAQEGPMGSVLRCILDYELGNWSAVRCGSLELATIRQCYLDALSSTRERPKVTRQDLVRQ